MTITRRGFFKLAAAGAAVALVPVDAVEAVAEVFTPKKPSRSLWYIRQIGYSAVPAGVEFVDLELICGNYTARMRANMIDMSNVQRAQYEQLAVELDVDLRDGKLVPIVDGKPVQGVRSFEISSDMPTIQFADEHGCLHTIPAGLHDPTPVQEFTAVRKLRGER